MDPLKPIRNTQVADQGDIHQLPQAKKLKEVAVLYEKQFLREMVKAMRGTVNESGFIKSSQAEKIFREGLDHEHVERWGDQGGVGLSDLIYKQLLERYGEKMGIKAKENKPYGPLPLDEKSNFSGFLKQSSRPNGTAFKIQLDSLRPSQFVEGQDNLTNENYITNPWGGKLLGSTRLDLDENVFQIQHNNGTKSQIAYRGQNLPIKTGDYLEPGQRLGRLSPDAKEINWTLDMPGKVTVSE